MLFHTQWIRRIACLSVVILGIATACHNPARAGTKDLWDTRVAVLDECPITAKEELPKERHALGLLATFAVSLFNVLLPKAIDVGLSYVASETKKAGQADASVTEVSGLGWVDGFYRLSQSDPAKSLELTGNLANKCLVVARGLYGEVTAKYTRDPWTKSEVQGRIEKLGLKSDPGVYLEARFRPSKDGTHFRIEPIRFALNKPLKDGTPPTEELDLIYEFKFQTPVGQGTNSAATFALGNLILRQVVTGEYLKGDALAVTSTGWMPVLANTTGITSVLTVVSGLYTSKETLTKEIGQLNREMEALEKELNEQEVPQGEQLGKFFAKEQANSVKSLAEDIYDDTYHLAYLGSNPETADLKAADAQEKAKRELAAATQKRKMLTDRAALQAKKAKAELGLTKLALRVAKQAELEKVTAQIKKLEDEKPIFAPVNIVVSIREQRNKPANKFLLTAAEILEGSKEGIRNVVLANITPEGREQQEKNRLVELNTKAELVIAAMNAFKVAQEKEIALRMLPSGATDLERLTAQNASDTSKITANVAYQKAGMDPPYKEAFAGSGR